MSQLTLELAMLTPAERRDLAYALLRAARSASLEEVRMVLLDVEATADQAVLAEMCSRLSRGSGG